jgi:hypothetical protein
VSNPYRYDPATGFPARDPLLVELFREHKSMGKVEQEMLNRGYAFNGSEWREQPPVNETAEWIDQSQSRILQRFRDDFDKMMLR